VIAMPTCDICREEEDTLTKCTTCGSNFCEYCGSIEDKLCVDCYEYGDTDESEDGEWL
jgi:hypothetical protein